jgi:hypothetical protein
MRSTKQKHFLILEQQPLQVNWQPTNRRFSFDWLFLWGMQSAFQGASGMLYFSWQRMPGGCEQYHDGVVPHDVRIEKSQQEKLIEAKNHLFSELKKEFGFTDCIPLAARDVLCIHDSESLWSHEITAQSVTYNSRKQIDHVTQFCLQSGLGLWFAPSLESEKDRIHSYKLIVLPGHAFELTDTERKLLKTFRSKGGRVLSLPRTGYKTRNNKLSPMPAVFYSEQDFYLDDYGALLENETETCDLNDTAVGAHMDGHLWSEKIQILNKSWTPEAVFNGKSIYAGSPAILKLKEDSQHGAHVHLATCPVPRKETWSTLRRLLDLQAIAVSGASDLQLQLLETGTRRFLAGVHFGHHPSSLTLPSQQKTGRIVQISLNPDLSARVERVQQNEVQNLSVPARSAILLELLP